MENTKTSEEHLNTTSSSDYTKTYSNLQANLANNSPEIAKNDPYMPIQPEMPSNDPYMPIQPEMPSNDPYMPIPQNISDNGDNNGNALSYGFRRINITFTEGNNSLIQNNAERFAHMLNFVNNIRIHGAHLTGEKSVLNHRRIDHALDLIHDAYEISDRALRERIQA